MPLPALPENNTDRLFILYNTGGGASAQDHVMSIRFDSGETTPAIIMDELANQLDGEGGPATFFTGWRVTGAEVQLAGAIPRLPVTVPFSLLSFVGAGQETASPAEQARELRYIGRGLETGRKVSFSLYGVDTGDIGGDDFRFTPSPTSTLGRLREMALAFGTIGHAFLTIAGENTNWYNYLNWQYNSHWERELRA